MTKYYRIPSVEGETISKVGQAGKMGVEGHGPLSREKEFALLSDTELFDRAAQLFDTEKFCCFRSKKQFFVVLNILAAIFHLSLFVMTIIFTCNSDAKCNGPIVYTYQTNLTYVSKTTTAGFELVPQFVKNVDNPLYLVSLPLIFFGLSCTAHVIISVLAGYTNIYRDWLLTCQQPVRYARSLKNFHCVGIHT